MINTTETTQTATVAASAAARTETVDPDLFARELDDKVTGVTAQERQERMASAMERMAAAFPGMTVSSASMSGFFEVREYYEQTAQNTGAITVSPEMMEQMAEDDALFEKVKELVSSLFSAGQQQNLVNGGGSQVTRNVNVDAAEIRYVEVHRNAGGAQMAISSLALAHDQLISDALDMLLASRQENSAANNGGVFSRNSSNQQFNLLNLISNSNAWRFESFVSAQSMSTVAGSWSGGAGGSALDRLNLTQSFSASMSLEVTIQQWQTATEAGADIDLYTYMQIMELTDPLVLDLGGEGINLRSAEDGVYFDIKGDGSPTQTAFIQGNNAFLYHDGNGNGVVDDVSELFGDYGGYANGFEKLARYDDNGDGVIDENDAVYKDLRVWRDLNGDGVNQADESMTLAEAGVKSIDLRYKDEKELDSGGNVIGERSFFTRTDGTQGQIADVWLRSLRNQ